ncbi:WxL protein peptidoglycan domain-containing protein [Xylanimonas protaetiae]|nr:DUF916 domain-containing protein [Xylanimonas protaetiae]
MSTTTFPAPARAHARRGLAALLATAALVATAAPALAADDETPPWSVTTANNDFGSGRQHFEYAANHGEAITDGFEVHNPGTDPMTLAVYAADAFTTADGHLDLRTDGEDATGVGAWLSTGGTTVTVAPGQSADVPFTLRVPAGATPGDHVGGVVTSREETAQDGTRVERRIALEVRVRVGGALRPGLTVEDAHVHAPALTAGIGAQDATVTYTIRNSGDAALAAHSAVSVAGPFGAARVAAAEVDDSPELLPGETWKVTVPVHGVRALGPLAASVTLTPLLADAGGSVQPLDAVAGVAHGWTTPGVPLLVLLVLVAAGIVVARRRRGAAGKGASADGSPADATDATSTDADADDRAPTTV